MMDGDPHLVSLLLVPGKDVFEDQKVSVCISSLRLSHTVLVYIT